MRRQGHLSRVMVITSVVPDGPMSIVKSSFPVAASPDPAVTSSVGIVAGCRNSTFRSADWTA